MRYSPVINGVVESTDCRATTDGEALTSRWLEWNQNRLGIASTATPLAHAAILFGSTDGGMVMLDDINARYAPHGKFPSSCDAPSCTSLGWWNPSQAGWYIRALREVS